MTTRNIRPCTQHTTCDVCGRNLLRGEHADVYMAGGERHWVCDLCVSRALQGGWVREGTVPPYEPGEGAREHRRPLAPRLRSRLGELRGNGEGLKSRGSDQAAMRAYQAVRLRAAARAAERVHEPRHVHAIPTGPEQKVSSAIRAFNDSEHTRTIAGVARSLGSPAVSVLPSDTEPSVVRLVAAWELCWYRYEVDLADEIPSVRVAAQGAELEELEPTERETNAAAYEDGALALRR